MELIHQLHFLRPWWLLAIVPVAWLLYLGWQTQHKSGAWSQVIATKFQKLLLGSAIQQGPSLNQKMALFLLGFIWTLLILALSGPWIQAVEVPAKKSQQGTVIVLDLSLSMLADDIAPQRLTRAKYLLTDLIKQHPEYASGMVAYAGSAHTISPISEDNATLLSLIPSLNPLLMPQYGSEPLQAMHQAEALLNGNQITQGHIIWLTDDIETAQIEPLVDWFKQRNISLAVMTIGTQQGGVIQIPNYGLLKDEQQQLVHPRVPLENFQQLAQKMQTQGVNFGWTQFDATQQQLDDLLPDFGAVQISDTANSDDQEKSVQHPLDIGMYLLLLVLPLALVFYRRGVLLSLLLILPLSMPPDQVYAAEKDNSEIGPTKWSDIFKSSDQLGYQAWQKQQYAAAEAQFEDPQWRASALYKLGKYKQAAELFQRDKSAQGQYNMGNALAMDQQLDKAKQAYEQALKLNPDLTAAKDNLKLVEDLLKQQEQAKNQSESKQNNHQSNQQNIQQNQQPNQQSGKSANESSSQTNDKPSASSDNKVSDKPSNDSAKSNQSDADKDSLSNSNSSTQADNTNSQKPDKNQANHSQNALKHKLETQQEQSKSQQNNTNTDQNNAVDDQYKSDKLDNSDQPAFASSQNMTEQQQAQQNWLQQIPDQPGLFLQRKFEYQYQQNQHQQTPTDKPW